MNFGLPNQDRCTEPPSAPGLVPLSWALFRSRVPAVGELVRSAGGVVAHESHELDEYQPRSRSGRHCDSLSFVGFVGFVGPLSRAVRGIDSGEPGIIDGHHESQTRPA